MPTTGDGGIEIEPVGDEAPQPRRPHRRLILVAGAGVGVGLLMGWTLRSTSRTADPSPSSRVSTPTAVTAAAATTTLALATSALPTTTLPPIEAGATDTARLPSRTNTLLVTRFANGDLLRVDVDRGRASRTRINLDSTGPVSIVAEPDRVLLRPLDQVAGYAVRDEGRPEPLTGALAEGALALYPGPDTQHVWRLHDGGGGVLHVDLVEIDTGTTLLSVPVPGGRPRGPDGTGNALVQAPGGAYAIGADGTNRITTGYVLAAAPTRWLVLECDDHLDCATATIDRATGDRRVLPLASFAALSSDLAFADAGTIAPDGRHAAYVGPDQSHVQLADLDTGTERPIADAEVFATGTWSPTTAWSTDGRYLFYLNTQRQLVALDLTTSTVTTLLAEPLAHNPLAARATG